MTMSWGVVVVVAIPKTLESLAVVVVLTWPLAVVSITTTS